MQIHPDILAVIFEQLLLLRTEPPQFLRRSLIDVALVCKQWSRQALGILWKEIKLTVSPRNESVIGFLNPGAQTEKLFSLLLNDEFVYFAYESF
ncbi:hypothetical protein HK096_004350, partial [Nowakowskiella sp. JEL0078]